MELWKSKRMDNNELSGYDVTVKYTMAGMVKRERMEADVRKSHG